ncbi:hypothetical protein BCR44DRAFT_1431622, partial [Catenaria anguillulae PL171]
MLVKCQPLCLRTASQLKADNGATYLTHQLLGGFRGSGHVPMPQLKLATAPSSGKDKADLDNRAASPEIVSPASPEPTPDPQSPPRAARTAGLGANANVVTSPTTSADGSSGGSPALRDDLFLLVARPYPLPPHDTSLDELIQLKVENERLRATLAAKYAAFGGQAAAAPPIGSVLRESAYDELLVVSSRNRQQRQQQHPSQVSSRAESEVDVGGGDSLDGAGNQLDRMDIDATSPLTSPALAAVVGARTGSQQYLPAAGHGSGLAGVITPSDFIDANLIAASTQGRQINRKRTRGSKQTDVSDEGMVCMDCGRTNSPEWRKGPTGEKCLCNACGLRYAKRKKTEKAALGTSLPANNPAILRLQQQIAAATAAAALAASTAPPALGDEDEGQPMVTSPSSTASVAPLNSSNLATNPPTTSPPARSGSQRRAGRPAAKSTSSRRRVDPPPPLALYKPATSVSVSASASALDHPALHLHSPTSPTSNQQTLGVNTIMSSPTSQTQSSLPFQSPPPVTSIPPQSIHMYTGTGPPPWSSSRGTNQDVSVPPASAYGSPPSRSMSTSLGYVPKSGSSAGSYTATTSRYLAREPPSRNGAGGAPPGLSASSSSSEMDRTFGSPAFGGSSSVPQSGTTSGSSANDESPFQNQQHQFYQQLPPMMAGRAPSNAPMSPPGAFSVEWAYAFGTTGGVGPTGVGSSGNGPTPGTLAAAGGGGPSGWDGSLFDDFDAAQVNGPLGQGLMPLNGSRLWSTPSARQQQQLAALFSQVMHSPPPPQQHQQLQQQQASGPPSRRSHSVVSTQGGGPARHMTDLPNQMPASMLGPTPVTSAGPRGGSRADTPELFGGHPVARAGSRLHSRHPSPAAPSGYFDPDLCASPARLAMMPPAQASGSTHGHCHSGPAGPFDTYSPTSYMAAATAAAAASANQQYPPQSYYSPHHPPSVISDQEQQRHHRASFMAAAAGVPQSYVSGPRPSPVQVEHMAAFMDHIRNEQMQMYQAGLSPTWASARGKGRGSSVGSGRFDPGY